MLEDSKIFTNHSEIFESPTNPLCGFVCFSVEDKSPSVDVIDDYLFLISPPPVLHSFLFVSILFYCFAITDKIKIWIFITASHIN